MKKIILGMMGLFFLSLSFVFADYYEFNKNYSFDEGGIISLANKISEKISGNIMVQHLLVKNFSILEEKYKNSSNDIKYTLETIISNMKWDIGNTTCNVENIKKDYDFAKKCACFVSSDGLDCGVCTYSKGNLDIGSYLGVNEIFGYSLKDLSKDGRILGYFNGESCDNDLGTLGFHGYGTENMNMIISSKNRVEKEKYITNLKNQIKFIKNKERNKVNFKSLLGSSFVGVNIIEKKVYKNGVLLLTEKVSGDLYYIMYYITLEGDSINIYTSKILFYLPNNGTISIQKSGGVSEDVKFDYPHNDQLKRIGDIFKGKVYNKNIKYMFDKWETALKKYVNLN